MNCNIQILLVVIVALITLYLVWPCIKKEKFEQFERTIITENTNNGCNDEVAYNDILLEHPDGIRSFNDVDTKISFAQSDNLNKQFDNTYYLLWQDDQKRDKYAVGQNAIGILETNKHCVDFENINQCMSVCSNTDTCSGFYINSPNKCCMLLNPPYVSNRDRHSILVDNSFEHANRTINNMVRHSELSDDKIIFNRSGSDGFNDKYISNLDRDQCKSLCPKCIIGRCPDNYRCTNLTADPRYNHSCIITNEGRYDETVGHTFDGNNIPYLDQKYGLNDYVGYNEFGNKLPSTFAPSNKIHFNENLVITKENAKNIENFDLYVNRDGFDPASASDDAHIVAIKGGNDTTNIHGYIDQKFLPQQNIYSTEQPNIHHSLKKHYVSPTKEKLLQYYCCV
ncbi:putative ORFan [Tupanvirus deep ocean]|uniref:ORFan n=2 Tax=Tupanvirus TaxID=2094720 RepID=A0AC62A8W8_9VIRU|nr:putative ORFan [Tupanvirus deep ocean]QKU34202.1 putative ORFan [Tupanvirus deep ocean]